MIEHDIDKVCFIAAISNSFHREIDRFAYVEIILPIQYNSKKRMFPDNKTEVLTIHSVSLEAYFLHIAKQIL